LRGALISALEVAYVAARRDEKKCCKERKAQRCFRHLKSLQVRTELFGTATGI
jgi:hypothetical protein